MRQKISMLTMEKNILWEFKCKKKICGFMWDEKQRNKSILLRHTGKSVSKRNHDGLFSDITVANQNIISVPIPDKGMILIWYRES